MKRIQQEISHLLPALAAFAVGATALHAGTVSTVFSFQKGNVLKDGSVYVTELFDGATYSGVVDGRVADNTAASALSATATATLGNQFQSGTGHNGMQHCGLFSYDLSELNNFIAANTGPYSSVTIQSVSFQLITSSVGSGTAMTLGLYATDPFTSSGCTWSNYTTGTPWTSPYQSGRSETTYNFTGGPSALTTGLGGSNPTTGTSATPIGTTLTWTSSANFISALTNALARPDKTLYLTARGTFFNNGDNRVNVNTSPATTVENRPKLLVTLNVTTTAAPATWTGATNNSWTTATNWSTGSVPATDAPITFNSSSTANLSTVLNQDFTVTSVTVADPTAAVSIGGANNLNLGAGGFDLSAATQNLTVSTPVVLGAIQSWNVTNGRTLGVSGAVSGNFPLTIAGAGKVSLGASNILPNGASAGNLAVTGTLDLNGTTQSVNALTGSGTVDNTAAGTASLTVGGNDATGSFSGIIQDTGGALSVVKTGTGQLTLTGANDFSGGFTNNGTGSVVSNNNLAFGTGPVVFNSGTIYPTAVVTYANALTLNGSILRIGGGSGKTITWNGPVTATGTSGLVCDGGTSGITLGSTLDITGATFNSGANGTTNNIIGNITGAAGNLNVTQGTLQVSGASNTYGGTTTINTGCFLRLDATGTLPASGNVVNNGGGLTIRNTSGWTFNGTITGDGVGSISLNTGTNATLAGPVSGIAAISVNSTATNTAISGSISGAANITVQGGAILTLSGNNSALTGTVTTIGNAANTQLNINHASALGTGTLSIGGGDSTKFDNTSGTPLTLGTNNAQTWNSNFTFVGSNALNLGAGAVTMGGNRTVSVTANTLTIGGVIGDGGSAFGITKTGAGTLALLGANTYTGATTINGGTLALGAAGSITSSGALSIAAGGTLDTSAQATCIIPGTQPVAIAIDATGSGSSGKIAAAGLDITSAVVTYNITGTPDDPVYVLATYSSLTGSNFASVSAPPSGYILNYSYEGNKIALVQASSGYSAWQSANSTTSAIDADHDGDGVSNGVEYFLYGNAISTGFTALPGVTNSGGTLSVTWTKAAGYTGAYTTDFVVETSSTLNGSWTPAALGTGPDQVEITGTAVKYTFPAGTIKFARLKVTGP